MTKIEELTQLCALQAVVLSKLAAEAVTWEEGVFRSRVLEIYTNAPRFIDLPEEVQVVVRLIRK